MQADQYSRNKKRKDELPDAKPQPFLPFKRTDIGNADFSSLFFLFGGIVQV